MPKPRHSRFDCTPGCSIEATLSLIDGKWKGVILFHLLEGAVRFNELRRRISCLTQRTLTAQLRELETDGLVVRTVYPQVPPKVEYSLSPLGHSLGPVFVALASWGDAHLSLFTGPPPTSSLPQQPDASLERV
ncbi:MAG: winged helix-turn-helix transcriptional regulator [Janthinobacterium lividum]